MDPLVIKAFTTSNAAGIGNTATVAALRAGTSGLKPNDLAWAPLECWIGQVPGVGDDDDFCACAIGRVDVDTNRLPAAREGRPAMLRVRPATPA